MQAVTGPQLGPAQPRVVAAPLKPNQPNWADIRGKLLERMDTIGSSFSTAPPSPDNSTSTAAFRRDSVSSTASIAQALAVDGPPAWLRLEFAEAEKGKGTSPCPTPVTPETTLLKTVPKTSEAPAQGKVFVACPKPSGQARAKSPEGRLETGGGRSTPQPPQPNHKVLIRSKTGVDTLGRGRDAAKAKTQTGLTARRGQSPVSVLRPAPRLVVPPASGTGVRSPERKLMTPPVPKANLPGQVSSTPPAPKSPKSVPGTPQKGGSPVKRISAPPSPKALARAVSAVPAATARGPRSPATRETMRMEEHKNIARDKKLQTAKTMPLRSSFESETYEALQKLHSDANLIREVLDDKQKLQKYSRSCFSNADVNGDGELSFEELLQCMQKMNAELGIGKFTERHVEHYLQRFDTDQDKLLSQEEFQELYRVLLMVKLEEVEPVDFSRNMFINRRKGKPEDDYRVQGIVGVGSFGVVRKVQCRSTGATRVMKVVDKQKALSGGYPLKLIMEEIDKLRTLDHPAVLRLFEYCADERNLYLITDMLPGGDLLDAVEGSHNKKKYLEEPWVRDVFRQVSEGVAYCNAKGIMHKDLKLENIMLASVDPPEAVVIDVGLAELFPVSEADSFRSADPAGTLATMAPEVVRGSFNAKCDVWSLGCCLYALLCHRPLRLEDHLKGEGGTQTVELYDYFYPFTPPPDESRQELKAYLVRQKEGPNLKRLECSDEAKDLIGKLLTFDKEQRPSMRQALSHCWLHSSKASGQISTEQLESLLQFHRINPLAQAVLLDLSSQLPLKQLREMISLFESVDKDGNGMLDEAELSEALKLAGLGAEMALEAAKRLAKGAGGVVEFSRFVAALAPASALVDVEMLRSSFNRLDANGDGYVSRSELQRLLERGAKPISVLEEEVPPEKKAHAAEKARQAFDGISGEGRLRISFASFQRHLGAFVA